MTPMSSRNTTEDFGKKSYLEAREVEDVVGIFIGLTWEKPQESQSTLTLLGLIVAQDYWCSFADTSKIEVISNGL